MDNLTAGNPVAHAVRVHFVDTSTLIEEGMPVCYNFDTTSNWWGGSVADTGEVTAAATLADGNQNPAKYLEVELPSATNIQWFAGFVKKGGWVGKTTSGTSGIGQILDIYVPNGAIIPVRTDQTCLIGQTILAITVGESELGVPLGTDSRPVAIAMETEDRETAGLVLAKVDPSLFLYQDHAGTPLSVDDADTTTGTQVNYSNIKFLGSSYYNRVLYMIGELAGGGAATNGMFKFRTYINSTLPGVCQVVCGNMHIKDDAVCRAAAGGEYNSVFYATIETEMDSSYGDMNGGYFCAYQAVYYANESGGTAPGRTAVIGVPVSIANYTWDAFLMIDTLATLGGATTAKTGDADAGSIAVLVGGVTRYLQLWSDDGS